MTDLTAAIETMFAYLDEREGKPLVAPDMNKVMRMTLIGFGINPDQSEDEIKAAFAERFGEWPAERVYYD